MIFEYLSKRTVNDQGGRKVFFHSSAYGRAQSGSSIGAAGADVFAERRQVEQQRRRVIRAYDKSKIGRNQNMVRPMGAEELGEMRATNEAKRLELGLEDDRQREADARNDWEKRNQLKMEEDKQEKTEVDVSYAEEQAKKRAMEWNSGMKIKERALGRESGVKSTEELKFGKNRNLGASMGVKPSSMYSATSQASIKPQIRGNFGPKK